ncbi:MAG: PP0621 family protein [Betaproteobacteria bacterium]
MGKVVFWVVVVFAILFAVRLVGAAQAKKRRERDKAAGVAGPMVRCERCGVFLPRSEAVRTGEAFRCRENDCALPR